MIVTMVAMLVMQTSVDDACLDVPFRTVDNPDGLEFPNPLPLSSQGARAYFEMEIPSAIPASALRDEWRLLYHSIIVPS